MYRKDRVIDEQASLGGPNFAGSCDAKSLIDLSSELERSHNSRKPVIRGSRLAVDFIVGLLGQGWTEADILRNYPGITHDDIAACLQYASEILQSEKVYPVAIA
jgi:uncharacterized protein (DUF433 family)